MRIDERRDAQGSWAVLAGLSPLYVVSGNLATGLVLGLAFMAIHSTASIVSMLLPERLGGTRVFALALSGAAIAASLTASVVRLFDPFLFETTHELIFLTVMTIPVMRASIMPESEANRERAMENTLRGFAYALSVILFGAFRELVATGALLPGSISARTSFLPIAAQPAGAFVLLGLLAAAFRAASKLAKGFEP